MYLFFGGLTTGIFIVAVVADLIGIKARRFDTLSKVGTYCAIVSLGLAGFFITAHLGKPERGMVFPLFFTNFNSWMTLGGWIVAAAGATIMLYAVLRYFDIRAWVRRLVGVLGIPVVAMLAVYTGLVLSQAGFVPLWSKKFLPLLFLNSGVTTGLAAVGFVFLLAWPFLAGQDDDPHRVVRWVSLAAVVFIVLELFELYKFLTFLEQSNQRTPTGQFIAPKGGARAYHNVVRGDLAPWFWGGIIAVGLLLPLLLTIVEFLVRPWARGVATTKFALMLIGGVLLRFVIVWGGNLKAPLDFPPSKWPIPPLVGG
jgi:protein NrfD